jgi:hypothetical protein
LPWWRREAGVDNEEGLDPWDKVSSETNRASEETVRVREDSSELFASKKAEKEGGRKVGRGKRWEGEEEEVGSKKLLPTSHGRRRVFFREYEFSSERMSFLLITMTLKCFL